ncbi:hypothetical protein GTJ91_21620 [Pseudomonas oryzihabitans]|nr:hypothetical protein [Pseudomonas oryzihabitans]
MNLEILTDAIISSHSKLRADLQLIREQGWSVGDGERVLGTFGIGIPFLSMGRLQTLSLRLYCSTARKSVTYPP